MVTTKTVFETTLIKNYIMEVNRCPKLSFHTKTDIYNITILPETNLERHCFEEAVMIYAVADLVYGNTVVAEYENALKDSHNDDYRRNYLEQMSNHIDEIKCPPQIVLYDNKSWGKTLTDWQIYLKRISVVSSIIHYSPNTTGCGKGKGLDGLMKLHHQQCSFPVGNVEYKDIDLVIKSGCLSRPISNSRYCLEHSYFDSLILLPFPME